MENSDFYNIIALAQAHKYLIVESNESISNKNIDLTQELKKLDKNGFLFEKQDEPLFPSQNLPLNIPNSFLAKKIKDKNINLFLIEAHENSSLDSMHHLFENARLLDLQIIVWKQTNQNKMKIKVFDDYRDFTSSFPSLNELPNSSSLSSSFKQKIENIRASSQEESSVKRKIN